MSDDTQKLIASLKRRRSNAKGAITRVENFCSTLLDEATTEDIHIRLELLEGAYSEFKELDQRLVNFDLPSEIDDQENRYCKLKASLKTEASKKNVMYQDLHKQFNKTMRTFVQQQQDYFENLHEKSMSAKECYHDEIRLPKISIPPFSGSYADFPSFKDLFESSIHKIGSLSKIHKFKYLKSLLIGDAATLVKHIQVTEVNYDSTWQKVCKRYDHKDHIMNTLIRQFLDQPKLQGRSRDIRHMADTTDEILRGVKALGAEAESRDCWLVHLLLQKCDEDTKKYWALQLHDTPFPKLEVFIEFLNTRSDALEKSEPTLSKKPSKSTVTNANVNVETTRFCLLCNNNHALSQCEGFKQMNVTARRGFIAEKGLCFTCMGSRHLASKCKTSIRCFKCKRRHHHLLHFESNEEPTSKNLPSSETSVNSQDVKNLQIKKVCAESCTILPTAMLRVKDGLGKLRTCRALLDSGSQASFIDARFFQQLYLPKRSARISISGLATSSMLTEGCATIEFMPRNKDGTMQADFLILKKLPLQLPAVSFKLSEAEKLEEELADPKFCESGKIDMLIGADVFFKLLRDGKKSNSSFVAQNTVLGYVVSGGIQGNSNVANLNLEFNVDQTLRRFWEQEELCSDEGDSLVEQDIENHFKEHVKRDETGRFIVKLPFKPNAGVLGNSSSVAKKRFLNLERKLTLNTGLAHEYRNFMAEYEKLNHMRKITNEEINAEDKDSYYLPHHAVIKQDSITTKVRVVFDGSCRTTSELSLNDTLLVGPTIQSSLWDIILRFRTHKFAISADITKMYRQIKVDEGDANYQRIFWRENSSQPLQTYKLITVTYGTASAPFLATRCLTELASENMSQHPDAATCIKNDFYVDDLLTGADTVEKLGELKRDIMEILATGGFELRKWSSNVNILNHLDQQVQISDGAASIKVLGLHWCPVNDYFSFKASELQATHITKRVMLSESSRLFDPLGWLAPSVVLIKIQFQKLWLLKLGWDDLLPDSIAIEWTKIRHQFKLFENLKIDRHIPVTKNLQLHAFADASERAYAAVIYCRSESSDGEVHVNLVTAKTKVSPLKRVSLPRLELCAALLAAKLLTKVSKSMTNMPHSKHAWTDSAIVLAWLSDYPSRWKQYVGNRTAEILNRCPREIWAHVKSQDNPADVASRGIIPSKLCTLHSWWHGPAWLKGADAYHIQRDVSATSQETSSIVAEMKKDEATVLQINQDEHFLEGLVARVSSFSRLLRVVVFVKRWFQKYKCKAEGAKMLSFITSQELKTAEEICIKWVQANELSDDIRSLSQSKTISRSSSLKALQPFLDENAILRVGGRLKNAHIPYSARHPIILPKNHPLSKMIVLFTHKKYVHAGASLTFSLCRQRFWILRGRSLVNQVVRECVTCARFNSQTPQQIMGQLPAFRVETARPFTNTGVDFTGAISLATKRGRGAKLEKGYIAVFICLTTKAIHLEVVSNYTSDAFIAAIRRFISRRGVPSKMYSDNGTNFIGADRKLRERTILAHKYLNQIQEVTRTKEFNDEIGSFLAGNSIEWHYIPPLAPHFGGIWESAVKIIKKHLSKATQSINLTFEEMTTLICNIEAIVNSRPLMVTSAEDINIEVLTPGHFLIGCAITTLPEPYDEFSNNTLPKLWAAIQQRTVAFWKKFRVEYLNNLQQRRKWQEAKTNLKVGDMVLLKEDFLPPCKWALGRVIELFPGDDQQVRVVMVKTANNIIKRPIVKIVPIPVHHN